MSNTNSEQSRPVSQFPGAVRISCPTCHKSTRTHMGSGWAVTWCSKCRHWFRTSNEVITPVLADQYRLPQSMLKEAPKEQEVSED